MIRMVIVLFCLTSGAAMAADPTANYDAWLKRAQKADCEALVEAHKQRLEMYRKLTMDAVESTEPPPIDVGEAVCLQSLDSMLKGINKANFSFKSLLASLVDYAYDTACSVANSWISNTYSQVVGGYVEPVRDLAETDMQSILQDYGEQVIDGVGDSVEGAGNSAINDSFDQAPDVKGSIDGTTSAIKSSADDVVNGAIDSARGSF